MASSRNNNDLLFDNGLVSSTVAGDLSNRYIDYLRSNKGLGSRTLRAYRVDVLQCLEWCGVNDLSDLNSVSTSVLRQWMYWLNKNHARSSLARKVVAVRGFFAWVTHVGLISANPAQILNTPKIVNELPTVLDESQAEKLLDCAEDRSEDYAVDKSPATEHQENTPLKSQIKSQIKTKQEYAIALRNAAILELLYATGMRVGELTGLNVQDMDFENHTVKVTGKGNKQRVVPFGVPAAKACKKWLDCGRNALQEKSAASSQALFLGVRAKRIDQRVVRDIVHAAAAAANVPDVAPHALRHSAATHMLNGERTFARFRSFWGIHRLTQRSATRMFLFRLLNSVTRKPSRVRRFCDHLS